MSQKTVITFVLFFLSLFALSAQEALKSAEEDYYDFLALQGLTERPYLNYRTLSDSVWRLDADAEHPWQGKNLGTTLHPFNGVAVRFYGPELFNSYNTAAPYGQNDGALWQGRGYNGSLTGGIRLEAYGVELTFKPQLAFSQNQSFEYIDPYYSTNNNYTDKGAIYGYYGVRYIDAPQRFGNEPFFTYDWGDSEVRYSWKTLTVGFGTQAIWLGPARLNPIIHSNNAPSYPKLDIGLRKQRITLPWLNWYVGDIETRAWWGYLSESDYYDNNTANDHNLITGFSIAYGVPFLPGLSLGLNRIMLSKWDEKSYESLLTLLWPFMETSAGNDNNDQRASVTIDYILPAAGVNVYLEWGRNDFSPNLDYVLRYPFHTEAYTAGVKKNLTLTNNLIGEFTVEVTYLENSMDYDRLIDWAATFYSHGHISQGHTNRGQWLGAGTGTGSNSQYLGFKLYYPRGYGQLFLQRRNPDLDYTWYIDSKAYSDEYKKKNWVAEGNIRAFLDAGISGLYYITPNFSVSGSMVFRDEHNPLNKSVSLTDHSSVHRYNVYMSAAVKYAF